MTLAKILLPASLALAVTLGACAHTSTSTTEESSVGYDANAPAVECSASKAECSEAKMKECSEAMKACSEKKTECDKGTETTDV
jgi:hypothetical protein